MIYQPHYTWIPERREDGSIASDLFIYVDDGSTTGPQEEYFWQYSRRRGSVFTHLGIQDASKKADPSYQWPVPWEGNVTQTEKVVLWMMSKETWENNKTLLKDLGRILEAEKKFIWSRLESMIFFIYAMKSY